MGKRKVSVFSVIVLIVGLSGLGLGAYSLFTQLYPPKALARASLGISYGITGASWHAVNFDVLDYDTTANFNLVTDRFICPISGYYLISGMIMMALMQDGDALFLTVNVEGVLEAGSAAHASQVNSLSTGFTDIVYLNAGDYVELMVWHTGASSRTINGNIAGTYTYLTIAATDVLN